MSTTIDRPPASSSAGVPASRRVPATRWWLASVLVALVATVTLTWPIAANLGSIWGVYIKGQNPPVLNRFGGSDALETLFVQNQVARNIAHLREPYLDSGEGAAGPAPLRTTSLDVPWMLLTGVAGPLLGLMVAYNLTLLAASALTVVTAFGLFRRHTRWPLLAIVAAVAYAFVPYRMIQLAGHFNAVQWWAMPALLWSAEVLAAWHREGRRWWLPTAWLTVVTGTVALSGEFHLTLYAAGLLCFLALWWALAALFKRRSVPWAPAALCVGLAAVSCGYSLLSFRRVFHGSVTGTGGTYAEVVHYAPPSLFALVDKSIHGANAEGFIYAGWPVAILALAGLVVALLRRPAARPYAILIVPLLLLTYGPTARNAFERIGLHGVDPYGALFRAVSLLRLQRVTARIAVVTAMVLLLLAVVAADAAGGWLLRRRPALARLAAVVLVVAGVWLVSDYWVLRNAIGPAHTSNRVVTALAHSGAGAPFVGLPVVQQQVPWNSASTYLAALSGRSTLNAYNQTAAPWLVARNQRLEPLNSGEVTPDALAALRETGTRQVVVIDEQHVYAPGQWRTLVDRLTASGHFRVVADDAPFALLELSG